MKKYHPPFISYQVSDYEESFKDYDLVANKKIFGFLDAMQDPQKLTKEKLEQILEELTGQVRDNIGELVPNDPVVMKHLLNLAPDKLLSSGDAVYSILRYALRNRDRDVLALVLSHKQCLRLSGRKGTALHFAASEGNKASILILARSMDTETMSKQDDYGCTALHWACYMGHADVASVLISEMKINDLDLPNKDGKTAFDLATGDIKIAIDTARFLKENAELKPNELMDKIAERENTKISFLGRLIGSKKPGPLDRKMVSEYLNEKIGGKKINSVTKFSQILKNGTKEQQKVAIKYGADVSLVSAIARNHPKSSVRSRSF